VIRRSTISTIIVAALLLLVSASSAALLDRIEAGSRPSFSLPLSTIRISIENERCSEVPFSQVETRVLHTEITGVPIRVGFEDGTEWESVLNPQTGSPMVPWIATVLKAPADIGAVSVKVLKSSSMRFDPYSMVGPVSPWEDAPEPGIMPSVPRLEGYRLKPIGYSHENGELLRVYSLWIRTLEPDGSGSAGSYEEVEVRITWNDGMTGPTPSKSTGDPSSVPGASTVSPKLDVSPEFIIITTEGLKGELKPLYDWRNRQGVPTSIVTVEDILIEYPPGPDPADSIRAFLKDTFEIEEVLRMVLLAGDWDLVPTKRVVDSDPYGGWDDGYIPADSYYSCLDGTWDLDGDGLYGEIGDMEDIIPDIEVSRLAINDPGTWEGKVDQLIEYDLGSADRPWADNAVLAAAHTHNEGDGSAHSDYLWEKYLKATYGRRTDLFEDTDTLSINSIDNAAADGCGLVQFVDHGGPTVWCDNYGAGVVYRDRDARDLENDPYLPVVSTLACLTTWFDDTSGCPSQRFDECIGESFTENVEGGAIGYIGSSRTSVGILGANRYLPYDNGLQEDYARQIGGLKEQCLGRSFTRAKEHYAEVWGGQFDNINNAEVACCWLEYTLLGDPSSIIWTGMEGRLDAVIEHENDLDPLIQVNVKDGDGLPVQGANVTLHNFDRGVFITQTTNMNGDVAFEPYLDWFCDINITVTRANYIPYRDYVRITDIIPPETEVIVGGDRYDPSSSIWFRERIRVELVPDENARVHYRIGEGAYSSLNSSVNFTLPDLPEGMSDIHFFAEDIAGNLESERHIRIGIDLHDPVVKITLDPPEPNGKEGFFTTEPSVEVSSQEGPGSPVSYYYSLDGGEILPFEGSFNVPDGSHLIRAYGEDLSGRTSNWTELVVKVDTLPPSGDHSLSPPEPDGENGWYGSTPELSLFSNEKEAFMEYKLSGVGDFRRYNGSFELEDGIWEVFYRAVDPAGNIEPTHSFRIKVDSTPPVVKWKMEPEGPDGDNGWYRTVPIFDIGWEDGIGAVANYRMDGGEWKRVSGPISVPQGEHELEFEALDGAGHSSGVVSMEVKVDTKMPETVLEVVGTRSQDWYSSSPVIALETLDDDMTMYRWGLGPWEEYYMPIEPPGREGEYTLHYHSRDEAGNVEEIMTMLFRVDSVDPELKVITREKGGGRFTLDLSGTEDGSDDLLFRVLEKNRELIGWTPGSVLELRLGEGSHRITVEVRDPAGNMDDRTLLLGVEGEGWLEEPYFLIALLLLVPVVIAAAIYLAFRRDPYGPDLDADSRGPAEHYRKVEVDQHTSMKVAGYPGTGDHWERP